MFKKKSKRIQKNLKRFKNADFNFRKFVKNYYIEKGYAYISAQVNSIEDIVSRFSTKGYEWINEEFATYVEESAYFIPVEEAIILEICGPEFTDEEKEIIEKVIKDYFGLRLGDKILDLQFNMKKAIALALFGVISFAGAVLLTHFKIVEIVFEIPLVLIWFALWECMDVVLFERYELKIQKLDAGQLSSLKIKYFTDKEREELEKQEKEAIKAVKEENKIEETKV